MRIGKVVLGYLIRWGVEMRKEMLKLIKEVREDICRKRWGWIEVERLGNLFELESLRKNEFYVGKVRDNVVFVYSYKWILVFGITRIFVREERILVDN